MGNDKIKISVVSYLNSKPFIHALNQGSISNEIDLYLDIPFDCATKLLNGIVDIGLVPVAIIPQIKTAEIISDYCIASDGPVGSVLLLSQVPLENITKIYLDYQSRTSVQLIKILAKKLWNIEPIWLDSTPGYEKNISGNDAGLLIGDRALLERNNFKYIYDLSAEWNKLTGLPFVFACWVMNKSLPKGFIQKFNSTLGNSSEMISDVVKKNQSSVLTSIQIETYLKENIHYKLDDRKKEGMTTFLRYLSEIS